ncbi:BatA domain-containing protein [Brevundimonas subvibrioides]|uniref:BatA domain-containing protein n=1 Tax=Brevundimonas subvibrioides TaxID=74313 RepID=UPI0022B37624|nr:BatA domain-containing protein [Brevundimonas subvibrioides]
MSPALLASLGLLALLALAIPVVIHIARRTENRTIDFAALRWLEARPNPRRSVTVDERWLLAVRLLLLTLLAVWLARPVLWNAGDTRPVVAVAPGVDAAILASLTDDEERRVWLAPGFPAVGGPAPRAGPDIASQIRQLDAELPPRTPLAIVVPATLDGVDAERPRLSRRVDWRLGPEATSPATPAPVPPLALSVRYAPETEGAVRYFRAAATAWTTADAQVDFDAVTTDRPIGRNARALVWLSPGPVPDRIVAWVRDGGTILAALDAAVPVEGETTPVWRDETGATLALAGALGRGRVVRLTRPLEPASIPGLVEATFPDALMAMLRPAPAPTRVAAAAWSPLTGAVPYEQPPLDMRPWLALLITAAFAAERWMATRRQRAVAP